MHLNELNYEMHCSQWEQMIPVMGKVGTGHKKNPNQQSAFSSY